MSAQERSEMDKHVDLYDNTNLKMRYEAYSRLQAAAVAFGETLPIPEIVAIGGQSDGKSSLLEAFLGFRFNVREVEIGTRRPLIAQMVHDPKAENPRCRLQDEDGDNYGPMIVPENTVADAIQKRTNEHLKKLGGATVSSKPIIMRVEYAFCPNLTIIDTPGLILKANAHEADSTPDDIMSMVKAQIAPSHRLILFLQQSSVEWASSLWMHVILEVDPHFQRTVVVASKFDNRLNEFKHQWEVDKYLSATGYLPSNVKPYFVALPKDKSITSSVEWRRAIQQVDEAIFTHLRENVEGGFDENQYSSRIGFTNLKGYLEEELARRYRDAAPSTLLLLQNRCESVAAELKDAEAKLHATEDVASLRRAAMQHAAAISLHLNALLDGATEPDPNQHGLTTDEEKNSSGAQVWPGVDRHVPVPNSELRLYGGAAFERCMEEFQSVASALAFPTVAQNRMANLLLAFRGRSRYGGGGQAAEDIARATAKECLGPLLEAACARLANILRKAFDIAVERTLITESSTETLRPFVAFHATLKNTYHSFITHLEQQTKSLVSHHLAAATSEFAMNIWTAEPDMHFERKMSASNSGDPSRIGVGWGEAPLLDITPSSSPERRGTILASGNPLYQSERNSYDDVCQHAEAIFQRIRHAVINKAVPATLKSAFLDPIRSDMTTRVSIDLFAQTDDDFMALFRASGIIQSMQTNCETLKRRVQGLLKCKDEFHELSRSL